VATAFRSIRSNRRGKHASTVSTRDLSSWLARSTTVCPTLSCKKVIHALNDRGKAVKNSRIVVPGLAYKANVDDRRQSPTFALMDRLGYLGAHVEYHDPYIPSIGRTREHLRWMGKRSVDWSADVMRSADLALISTSHSCFNSDELVQWADLIVDTRNVFFGTSPTHGQVVKA